MKITALDFLKKLDKNNNREWFTEHKSLYTAAREEVIAFVNDLIGEIAIFDPEVSTIDVEKSLFRIYRDTRFSHNKEPYKINFGANIATGKGKAGYYLHIQPEKSFLAGGAYMLENEQLKVLRQEIIYNAEAFRKMVSEAGFCRYFGSLSEEGKLKRVPAGFEKDDPMAEYLKLKNFVAIRPIADEELLEKNAAKKLAGMYKSLKPLKDFLNAPFL
ncbi:DUF2461 domain-containing protein [Chitinophaga nivalis]|uniref:DUF2461 domain-containing protein n=1 Tax=Chitinophaga nivalis TaxID=2991709 RepID=A0ABT3IN08_9BACT|nr:DUF2461 domain-containing protein [Chitinophaga nivalis]MCW3464950.1 DUF2461 domain-containing protein [Chitinophaga nivalis]MCW3485358.1 DUF2461 domain-containing protein [Chitinophaga nivalis]